MCFLEYLINANASLPQIYVEGCGFFLWVDSPNDGNEFVSIVRRVQLLEINLLKLQSKLDVMERKVHVSDTKGYSFFANDFAYTMKTGFVLVQFILLSTRLTYKNVCILKTKFFLLTQPCALSEY